MKNFALKWKPRNTLLKTDSLRNWFLRIPFIVFSHSGMQRPLYGWPKGGRLLVEVTAGLDVFHAVLILQTWKMQKLWVSRLSTQTSKVRGRYHSSESAVHKAVRVEARSVLDISGSWKSQEHGTSRKTWAVSKATLGEIRRVTLATS